MALPLLGLIAIPTSQDFDISTGFSCISGLFSLKGVPRSKAAATIGTEGDQAGFRGFDVFPETLLPCHPARLSDVQPAITGEIATGYLAREEGECGCRVERLVEMLTNKSRITLSLIILMLGMVALPGRAGAYRVRTEERQYIAGVSGEVTFACGRGGVCFYAAPALSFSESKVTVTITDVISGPSWPIGGQIQFYDGLGNLRSYVFFCGATTTPIPFLASEMRVITQVMNPMLSGCGVNTRPATSGRVKAEFITE